MKKARFVSDVLICVVFLVTLVATNSSRETQASSKTIAEPNAASIAELAWISGNWKVRGNGRAHIEEFWTRPSGSSMIGMARTVVGEKTIEFEYLRIEQRADAIYYVANPNGQCPPTDFKLIVLDAREVVFANPQHDFPKRIIYRRMNDGTLVASIDDGKGIRVQSFTYVPSGTP